MIESSEGLKIYKSTSKSKRPNDDLVESECARFKASGADFGIIDLPEIKRWMTISPVLQFAFFKSEKEANAELVKWEERVNDSLFANSVKNSRESPSSPENIISLIEMIKERIPDKYPGRLPTISVLDPQGGFWTTTSSRTISSMNPIFCPTVRFDMDPPELYYEHSKESQEGATPSVDSAVHAYYFAGLEFIGAVLNMPMRAHSQDAVSMITDGDLALNDLHVSDFILGQILEEDVWKDRNNPFSIAFGVANTTVLARRSEHLVELLQNDFFVRFEQ